MWHFPSAISSGHANFREMFSVIRFECSRLLIQSSCSLVVQSIVNEIAALMVLKEKGIKNISRLVEYGMVEHDFRKGKQVTLSQTVFILSLFFQGSFTRPV